mmetsp:Transcript_81285/g.230289  ORF Transcript_81285/g.230289 Transcript_81285/m.230289 type:complete len:446 (-) Transcript_81285:39-1376(-)
MKSFAWGEWRSAVHEQRRTATTDRQARTNRGQGHGSDRARERGRRAAKGRACRASRAASARHGQAELPLALRQGRHGRGNLLGRDLCRGRGLPDGGAALVDEHSPDTLAEVGPVEDPAGSGKVPLQRHGQAAWLRHRGLGLGGLHQLPHHGLAEGRTLGHARLELGGPAASLGGLLHQGCVGLWEGLGVFHLGQEGPVGCNLALLRWRSRQALDAGLDRGLRAGREVRGSEPIHQFRKLVHGHVVRREARVQRVARAEQVASRQRHELADARRHLRGEVGEADVREQADVVLRHGQPRLLRADANPGGRGQAEAESHGHALQQDRRGLAQLAGLVDEVVLLVDLLLGQLRGRVRHKGLAHALDVAARAEGLAAVPAQQHGLDGLVVLPRSHRLADGRDHGNVAGVEGLRLVDRQHRQAVGADLREDELGHDDRLCCRRAGGADRS